MNRPIAAVILAAGQGTRMKSAQPKVLHRVCGLPLVLWSVRNARALGAEPIVVVVGIGAEAVQKTVGPDVLYAFQAQRLGTGHAALQARELLLGQAETVLVLYGDMPNLRPETLARLVALHQERRPAITMLTVMSDDSMGFGRVVRGADGQVREIVEEAVATPEILALKELNCGIYCFNGAWLWEHLPQVPVTQPKGEYYLTDTAGLAARGGQRIEVLTIRDVSEVQGINTRVQLAQSERLMRERLNEQLMLGGVTLVDPATTYVEATVRVGQDTTLYPNTTLQGETAIGERCAIGPNSILRDTRVGNDCRVLASVLEGATLDDDAEIGPFGHLRQGAHLGEHVHMGNFGEVKNAYLAPGSKMGHFSYVGDAEVGADANIGAGAITCNYDGRRKHRTLIRAGAFIGSGALLVAPVTIGRRARIGAGAVVTHDVADRSVVYGVPARPHGEVPQEEEQDEER
jgi:bifunctional UDP-N-acetylglucosamine pyrophosphorylase / glucosamine-1-phosphate N-acetyltransferase